MSGSAPFALQLRNGIAWAAEPCAPIVFGKRAVAPALWIAILGAGYALKLFLVLPVVIALHGVSSMFRLAAHDPPDPGQNRRRLGECQGSGPEVQ